MSNNSIIFSSLKFPRYQENPQVLAAKDQTIQELKDTIEVNIVTTKSKPLLSRSWNSKLKS